MIWKSSFFFYCSQLWRPLEAIEHIFKYVNQDPVSNWEPFTFVAKDLNRGGIIYRSHLMQNVNKSFINKENVNNATLWIMPVSGLPVHNWTKVSLFSFLAGYFTMSVHTSSCKVPVFRHLASSWAGYSSTLILLTLLQANHRKTII